jgi:hypothetical protein
MEAVGTSKTSVNFYKTTRCNIPEDSHLHTRRHENLKSNQFYIILPCTSKYPKQNLPLLFSRQNTACKNREIENIIQLSSDSVQITALPIRPPWCHNDCVCVCVCVRASSWIGPACSTAQPHPTFTRPKNYTYTNRSYVKVYHAISPFRH